jgi:predicted transcriptional regulator
MEKNPMGTTKLSSNIISINLGDLELRVLEILWQQPHLDARQVREEMLIREKRRQQEQDNRD